MDYIADMVIAKLIDTIKKKVGKSSVNVKPFQVGGIFFFIIIFFVFVVCSKVIIIQGLEAHCCLHLVI